MISVITGAYGNAGDYLIGSAARGLLKNHVDANITNLDRLNLDDAAYDAINKSRFVLLTGGPAYQKRVYPKIYPLDLSRVKVPVVPFGLGWKGKLDENPADFTFSDQGLSFVQQVHSNFSGFSSARDPFTVSMLNANGVSNVEMTGCPAWYNEPTFNNDFAWSGQPKNVLVSVPAAKTDQLDALMDFVRERFPKSNRTLLFQAGLNPTAAQSDPALRKWLLRTAAVGALKGFRVVSTTGSLDRFLNLLDSNDVHLGYRVHAHIGTLARRKPSVLIAEDSRGLGQMSALGSAVRRSDDDHAALIASLHSYFDEQADESRRAVEAMKQRFPVMLDFLNQVAEPRS